MDRRSAGADFQGTSSDEPIVSPKGGVPMFAKSLSLLVLCLAAGSAMSAAPSYSSRGETQGMEGNRPAKPHKVDPRSLKKPAGTEAVPKASPGKPEAVKGKAKVDETAGTDPQKAGAGKEKMPAK
jgi:hypothetical protein